MDKLREYLESEKNLKLQSSIVMVQSKLHWLMLDQMRKFAADKPGGSLLEFIFENTYDHNEWDTTRVADFFSRVFNTLELLSDKDQEAQVFLKLLTTHGAQADVERFLAVVSFLAEFKNLPSHDITNLNKAALSAGELAILKRNFAGFQKISASTQANADGQVTFACLLMVALGDETSLADLTSSWPRPAPSARPSVRPSSGGPSSTSRSWSACSRASIRADYYKEKLQWTERLAELSSLITGSSASLNADDNATDLKRDLIKHFSGNQYTNITSLSEGLNEPLLAAREEFTQFVRHVDKAHIPHIYQLVELKLRSDLKRLRVEVEALDSNSPPSRPPPSA